jgi:transcription termination factor Rho
VGVDVRDHVLDDEITQDFAKCSRPPVLRKVLNPVSPVEAMELLIDKLNKTHRRALDLT